MMRLAVLSDIHGNWHAYEAVLADLESVGEIDVIWYLGDYAAFGPRPAECIRQVQAHQKELGEDKVKVIGGNTDRYLVTGERFVMPPAADEQAFRRLHRARTTTDALLNWNLEQLTWEDYQFLASTLGKETSLKVPGYGHVIGYHAVPGNDEAMLRPDTPEEEAADYLLDREGILAIGGHIHVQMDRQLGRWRVINVGSIGMSFDMPGKAQWGLFTFEDNHVTVELRAIDYDVDAALKDMQATDYPAPEWAARRLREGR
ncbi:MAG: metallophosphoesterase family protein [Phototrophicales bacterium]